MLRKWRKQEDDLRQVKKTEQSSRVNKARWRQLEDKTEQWVIDREQQVDASLFISIRLKATAVASDMKIKDFEEVIPGVSVSLKGIISPSAQELPSFNNCQRITKKSWQFSPPTARIRSLKRRELL